MRILKVWDSEYPWDVRTEKMCRALGTLGHEVHMVARNRDGRPRRETLDECVVHRMAPFRLLGSGLDRASQFPAFFNPRWKRLIHRTAVQQSVQAILVRDLPLAPSAIRVGRKLGLPVMLDMAENYPAMIRDLWTTGSTRFGDVLVRNPRLVAAVERAVLRDIDHVLVVVEESRDRLLSLGVSEERISVVSNTPSVGRMNTYDRHHAKGPEAPRSSGTERGSSSTRLVYLGLMEEARGVGLVIEAVAIARERGMAVTLDLIGDGRALQAFQRKARELDLPDDLVRFKGFVPYEQALPQVAAADAGLIPHFANESWETTIPNKLFDYMSLGLPVVASDVSPVARVLSETGAGVVFKDRDARDLADVLGTLRDRDRLAEMGRAGLTAVRSTYNWEMDMERLELALETLMDRPSLP